MRNRCRECLLELVLHSCALEADELVDVLHYNQLALLLLVLNLSDQHFQVHALVKAVAVVGAVFVSLRSVVLLAHRHALVDFKLEELDFAGVFEVLDDLLDRHEVPVFEVNGAVSFVNHLSKAPRLQEVVTQVLEHFEQMLIYKFDLHLLLVALVVRERTADFVEGVNHYCV